MADKIKAIIKRSDEPVGHVSYISNTLANLQRTVDGYIETVTFGNFIVICNEEGRLMNLPHNCTVNGFSFVGDIVVVGSEGEEFADCPISLKQWREIINA